MFKYLFLIILFCFYQFDIKAKIRTYQNIKINNYGFSKIQIKPYTYHKYIAPQLRIIVHDFNNIIKAIHPNYKKIQKIENHINELISIEKNFRPSSSNKITVLYEKIIKLELLIFTTLRKEKKNFIECLNNILINSNKILHLLELSRLSKKMNQKIFNIKQQEIKHLLSQMKLFIEISKFKSLPKAQRGSLFEIWNNFIKIIDKNVLIKNDINQYISRLERLNFIWNNFHRNISKSSKNINKRILLTIRTIHRRWNLILKSILRRSS